MQSFGAIEGRVTMTFPILGMRHVRLRTWEDHEVRAVVPEDTEVAEGQRVIIEGTVYRDDAGVPYVIDDVRLCAVLPESKPGQYKNARGALPMTDELPEDAIRRIRDM